MEVFVEANSVEKKAVTTVWQHMQQLLTADKASLEEFVGSLSTVLPQPVAFTGPELHELAKLHLSSAGNLMTTMRLVAPAAFTKDASHPDLSALNDLEGGVIGVVSILIELQLFHLRRAAVLTAHHRWRLTQRPSERAVSTDSGSSSSSAGDTTPTTTRASSGSYFEE